MLSLDDQTRIEKELSEARAKGKATAASDAAAIAATVAATGQGEAGTSQEEGRGRKVCQITRRGIQVAPARSSEVADDGHDRCRSGRPGLRGRHPHAAAQFNRAAIPVSTRKSGFDCTPLCWLMTGTPTETKPENRSTPTRTPGER